MTLKGESIRSIKISEDSLGYVVEGLALLYGYHIGNPDPDSRVMCEDIKRLENRLRRRLIKGNYPFNSLA